MNLMANASPVILSASTNPRNSSVILRRSGASFRTRYRVLSAICSIVATYVASSAINQAGVASFHKRVSDSQPTQSNQFVLNVQ